MLRMSEGDIGIMLEARCCMIQREPVSVMMTRTAVNISAMTVQPASDLEFMCRK